MERLAHAPLALGLAALLLLALAWSIGVRGNLWWITNYRRHPERYPDRAGLGGWMARTLALGGASFGFCAVALGSGAIGPDGMGLWTGLTGAGVALLALGGLARYRRVPPASPPGRGR